MSKELIQKNNLFRGFTLDDIEKLIELKFIQFKSYKKDATMHNVGDCCVRMEMLLSGSLSAYSLADNGSAISIFTFDEDSIIGCNLLFSNYNRYPLNIYCTKDSYVAYMDIENVSTLIEVNNHFAMEFIKTISNYSINLNSKMLTFSSKNLRERIWDYLNKEMILQQSNKIKLSLSKKQLADELGVQRPSLFRELKKMRDEGLIYYDNKYIIVL